MKILFIVFDHHDMLDVMESFDLPSLMRHLEIISFTYAEHLFSFFSVTFHSMMNALFLFLATDRRQINTKWRLYRSYWIFIRTIEFLFCYDQVNRFFYSKELFRLTFDHSRRIIFFTESSSAPNNYQIDWEHHYKEIKGSPIVKFEPNFIEITLKVRVTMKRNSYRFVFLKETNAIGMTKKDILHIRVVPYDNIGEARVSVFLLLHDKSTWSLRFSILLIK